MLAAGGFARDDRFPDRRLRLRRLAIPARLAADVRSLLPLHGLPAADRQRLRPQRADRDVAGRGPFRDDGRNFRPDRQRSAARYPPLPRSARPRSGATMAGATRSASSGSGRSTSLPPSRPTSTSTPARSCRGSSCRRTSPSSKNTTTRARCGRPRASRDARRRSPAEPRPDLAGAAHAKAASLRRGWASVMTKAEAIRQAVPAT